MMSRGRRLLIAQLPGEPLGPPPESLTPAEHQAWDDIVAAAPSVFQKQDRFFLEPLALQLACWRSAPLDCREWVRQLYRGLGHCFVPMAARRWLLFPDAPPSRSRLV